jgi:hypothetical protein
MRTLKLFFSTALFLFVSLTGIKSENNLGQNLSGLKDKIGEVPVDKIVFRQSFEVLNEEKGKVNFSVVEVDEKGKSSKNSYEFYISDIDKNTLVRKTSGKKLFVSISVNNSQKFVKHFKEDKLDSYVNNVDILALNSDAAQEIIDLFKATIPLVKSSDKDWGSAADALNWLKSNIVQVSTENSIVDQAFSFGERKEYLVTINVSKTDQKGTTISEKFEFNILDINKNMLIVKVDGTKLSVSLETSGSNDYIKHTKQNELQSYSDDLEIMAADIDNARTIIAAMGYAITKSKSKMPEFGNLQQALDFIKNNTVDLTIDNKPLKQKITFGNEEGTMSVLNITEADSKGNSIENIYEFYLASLEMNSLNFKVSGKKVNILCVTSNKVKLVKYTKANAPQNYQNDLEILMADIETTREVIEAFKFAAKNSEWKPITWKSMGDALSFLIENIKGETVGSDQYKLGFEGNSTEPYFCKYLLSKTDAKGVTVNQSFEFYPYMLEPNTLKTESEGKYLSVNIKVLNKKSFVKVYKDSKQQSFDNELEIMAFNAKNAREISEAFKYIAGNGKPKEKDWSDKLTAMNYVKDQVGNFTGEGKEIKQKLELANDDPCKVTLTVSTIDDKGKTTEEIFEFGLSDMNKMMVEYKISGKNVYVTLVCKNREKLVKAYKNGAQQSYGADVEILEDDVETARNIADALRSTVIQCEKK